MIARLQLELDTRILFLVLSYLFIQVSYWRNKLNVPKVAPFCSLLVTFQQRMVTHKTTCDIQGLLCTYTTSRLEFRLALHLWQLQNVFMSNFLRKCLRINYKNSLAREERWGKKSPLDVVPQNLSRIFFQSIVILGIVC